MNRKLLLDSVINLLGSLRQRIILANAINLTDLNINAENFYRDFLNELFGLRLTNINIDDSNAAAVDLGDAEARLAIQVTSSATAAKVLKTTRAFDRHKLLTKYGRLVLLNIGKPNTYKEDTIGSNDGVQVCTKKDVWNVEYLLKHIYNLDLNRLERVCRFLEAELVQLHQQQNSKEVETFNSLVYLLSDDGTHSGKGNFLDDPDPNRKLHARFADHAKFLEAQYQNLYVEYGACLEQVLKQADLGHTRIRRLALHLQYLSDTVLTENNGDARAALDALVVSFAKKLDVGRMYDETAIRFFLVHQLISCNVFPNPVSARV